MLEKRFSFLRTRKNFQDSIWVAQVKMLGWPRIILSGVGPVAAAVAIGYYMSSHSTDTHAFLFVSVAFAGWGAGYVVSYFFKCLLPVKFLREGGEFLGSATLQIENDGIRVLQESSESFTAWQGIFEIAERRDSIVLLTDRADGIVVPVSAFSDRAQATEFKEFVRSKIN